MTNIPDSVLNRIKKCLAMAQDGRGNEAEMATAMRMAQKMMVEWNVSEEGLLATEIGEDFADTYSWKKPPQWEISLAAMIGKTFGCKLLIKLGAAKVGTSAKAWHPTGQLAQMQFIGLRHQAQLAAYTFTVLRRQAVKARTKFLDASQQYTTRGEKLAAGESFCQGFISNVAKQVQEMVNEPLVQKAIEAKLNSLTLGKYSAPRRSGDYNAMGAGADAGKTASLHRPMNQGAGQLKLGR